MKKEATSRDAGVCGICGRKTSKNERIEMGESFYCTDCLGSKFDPVKEPPLTDSEDRVAKEEDGHEYANVFFFFLIGIPIIMSFLGLPNFFLGFLALVHELGHYTAMIADMLLPGDSWLFVVIAGSAVEFLVPFLSFLYVYPHRKIFVVSCLFLAASGAALIDIGRYMATAHDPSGYAYISGRPISYENHDWYLIFATLDLLDRAAELSEIFSASGRILEYVGLYTSLAAFFAIGSQRRQSSFFLYGISISLVHTILSGDHAVTLMLAILGAFLVLYLRVSREG